MHLMNVLLATMVAAIYIPANGDDWTLLKPEDAGAGIPTLDFDFGIVVSLVDEGEFANSNFNAIQNTVGQVRSQEEEVSLVSPAPAEATFDIKMVSCKTNSTLSMSLTGGILRDSSNRIGTMVSNRQFQFDGPTPQFGAVYANGWAADPDGYLVLGSQRVFYQCASGEFYNLYDQQIDTQCSPVNLRVVGLVEC